MKNWYLISLFTFLTILSVAHATCAYGQYEYPPGTCNSCSIIPGCLNCTSNLNCKLCAESYYIDSAQLCASCPSGCQECYSNTQCTSCNSGYFMETDNLCYPCGSNCQTCSTQTSCLSCGNGLILSGTSCISCNINDCIYCIENSNQQIQCAQCAIGFYLSDPSTCSECTMNGCATCGAANHCESCQLGYYLKGDNTCQQCDSSCSECTTLASCDACQPGFYLTGTNTCDTCTSQNGCLLCETSSECLQCHIGFYLDGSDDCQSCDVDDCHHCSTSGTCDSCNYGFVLESANTLCTECSKHLTGCISCESTSVCEVCQRGYFLLGNNCVACPKGCSDCDDSTHCNACTGEFKWNAGVCSNCENNEEGCSFCDENGDCKICQSNYYLVGTSCTSCRSQISGCQTCVDGSNCLICSSGYYKDANNECSVCSIPLQGCSLCSDSNTCEGCSIGYYLDTVNHKCIKCDHSNPGCLNCDSTGTCLSCESGYFLDSNDKCQLCKQSIDGCIFCSSDIYCSQCQGGYILNSVSNKCQKCSQTGCQICVEGDSSKCVTCNSLYYLDGNRECQICRNDIPGCLDCLDGANCEICETGYFKDSNNKCIKCSKNMQGCQQCSAHNICKSCQNMFYLDQNNNLCKLCSEKLTGCSYCLKQDKCQSCMTGFYLENDECVPCTTLPGCTFCSDRNTCLSCDKGFYLENNQCLNCSTAIAGCLSCESATQCIKCEGQFSLSADRLCQSSNVGTSQQSSSQQQDVKFKTKFISNETLVHYLLAVQFDMNKNTDLSKVDWDQNAKIKVTLDDGEVLELKIKMAEWGDDDKTIIFYTDNPLNLQQSDLEVMPFARRRLSSSMSTHARTSIQLSDSLTHQLMPNFNHVGPLSIDYSLEDPQFYTSYLKVAQQSLLWIIGMIVTVLLLVKYTVKACYTVPTSSNLGHIIPHIFALKAGALILYPTYRQYINYCTGYMTVDMPWLNQAFGKAFGEQADVTPAPFKVFFMNMNIGSTYLLPLLTISIVALILLAIAKFGQKQKRIYPYFQVLYCFFCFGVIFAGCMSFQGAILNPVQNLTISGFFYIIGIGIFFASFIEIAYSLKKQGKRNFWKVRFFFKATLLSLAHLSPIYLIAATILTDAIFIVVEYKLSLYARFFQKSWLIANISVNIALVLVVFAPTVIISLLFVTLFIVIAIVLESYMHHIERTGQFMNQVQEKSQKFSKRQQTQSNIWDLNLSGSNHDSNIYNIYNQDNILDEKDKIGAQEEKKITRSSDGSDKSDNNDAYQMGNTMPIFQDTIVAVSKNNPKNKMIKSKIKQSKANRSPDKESENEQEEQFSIDESNLESFVFEEEISEDN